MTRPNTGTGNDVGSDSYEEDTDGTPSDGSDFSDDSDVTDNSESEFASDDVSFSST